MSIKFDSWLQIAVTLYPLLSTDCPYRFSRASLNVDTGVTTVYIGEDTNGILQLYSTATSDQLPVVNGTSEQNLPSDCSISSLELLTSDQSWVTISHSGFELIREGEKTFVQVRMSDVELLRNGETTDVPS